MLIDATVIDKKVILEKPQRAQTDNNAHHAAMAAHLKLVPAAAIEQQIAQVTRLLLKLAIDKNVAVP